MMKPKDAYIETVAKPKLAGLVKMREMMPSLDRRYAELLDTAIEERETEIMQNMRSGE